MSIEVGTYIRVNTIPSPGQNADTTPFGTCIWHVLETGLECPEPWRKEDENTPMDGVKCVMIGGSGPSARAGYTVIDSMLQINKNIKDGVTTIVSKEEAVRLEQSLKKAAEQIQGGGAGGVGCLEID
jgi:hypothetical protein